MFLVRHAHLALTYVLLEGMASNKIPHPIPSSSSALLHRTRRVWGRGKSGHRNIETLRRADGLAVNEVTQPVSQFMVCVCEGVREQGG